MSSAIKHAEIIHEQPQFSFGPDEADIKIQIPANLKWETVQAWVDQNTKLFSKIANPYKKFLPTGTDAEDLKSMAYLAAFSAIEKAAANDRLDDFVPFFCRIYKTEIIKQAKGVPVVSLVELPAHELEGVSHDSALENVRFDGEPDTRQSEDEVISQSLNLLTNSQKQFVEFVFDNPQLSVAQLAQKLDILPSSVHDRVKVITARIPLKRMNQKPVKIRKYFMVKPVSDQKKVVPDSPSISIVTNVKKYLTVNAVSDQRTVRPDSVFIVGNSFRTIDRPTITNTARKGDTFLATRHTGSPSRSHVLPLGREATQNDCINRQKAPPGWFSDVDSHHPSSGRTSPTKGTPFVYHHAVSDGRVVRCKMGRHIRGFHCR